MNITVIGAGLLAACCVANSGHEATYVESDKAKLKLLNQDHKPCLGRRGDQLLKQGVSGGKLAFVPGLPKLPQLDIVMITVGTPFLVH